MGNSTKTLQDVIDVLSVIPNISPQANPGGYGPKTALEIGNKTMRDFIARAFNWKWNSYKLPPFYTNSYQQDYPGISIRDYGWIESYWWVDINNTATPPPSWPGFPTRDLPTASRTNWGVENSSPSKIAWLYNRNMNYGAWPGAQSIYTPPIGNPGVPNGPLAILDANGNILTLTGFGVTGNTAPVAAANSPEGTTITDGSCQWTVCDPNSQGFRIINLPSQTGPIYQCNVWMQKKAVTFAELDQLLDPIPDDYSQYFEEGYKAHSYAYSTNPADRQQAPLMRAGWLQAMMEAERQGDREPNAFGLVPTAQPVAPLFGWRRNPMDPARPY